MKKKILKKSALFLSLLLATPFVACNDKKETSSSSSAENSQEEVLIGTEGLTYALNEKQDGYIVTEYTGEDTHVTVASTHENLPVVGIAASAFADSDYISMVNIGRNITSIGESAFYSCDNLLGIWLPSSVQTIGAKAFEDCGELAIFCETEEENQPKTWDENWNVSENLVIWGHNGQKAAPVSPQATSLVDSFLTTKDDRTQLIENPDCDVSAPEAFSIVTRFDVRKEGTEPWVTSALWNYNYDMTDLRDYKEVYFATKAVGAQWRLAYNSSLQTTNWAYSVSEAIYGAPWVYVHLKQSGKDKYGYILWDIELSIGGYAYAKVEKQSGKPMDKDRPINSLARLLWDGGFGSEDGSAILFYSENPPESIFYCTEVLGVSTGL